MATPVDYCNGICVSDTPPTGTGGMMIDNNFKSIANAIYGGTSTICVAGICGNIIINGNLSDSSGTVYQSTYSNANSGATVANGSNSSANSWGIVCLSNYSSANSCGKVCESIHSSANSLGEVCCGSNSTAMSGGVVDGVSNYSTAMSGGHSYQACNSVAMSGGFSCADNATSMSCGFAEGCNSISGGLCSTACGINTITFGSNFCATNNCSFTIGFEKSGSEDFDLRVSDGCIEIGAIATIGSAGDICIGSSATTISIANDSSVCSGGTLTIDSDTVNIGGTNQRSIMLGLGGGSEVCIGGCLLGFYGSSTVAKQTLSATATTEDILHALHQLGLITCS